MPRANTTRQRSTVYAVSSPPSYASRAASSVSCTYRLPSLLTPWGSCGCVTHLLFFPSAPTRKNVACVAARDARRLRAPPGSSIFPSTISFGIAQVLAYSRLYILRAVEWWSFYSPCISVYHIPSYHILQTSTCSSNDRIGWVAAIH